MRRYIIAAAALTSMAAGLAFAGMKHGHDGHSFEMPSAEVGDLTIENPIIRATPPAAKAAGGYIKITNAGRENDTLISASIDAAVAAKVELHTMEMDGEVMRMFEVEGGISLPAGETVQLAPGGLHLMIMGLSEGMTDGAHHDLTLTFENAGTVNLNFAVMDMQKVKEITGAAEVGHNH